MKIRPMGGELFRADLQTDGHDEFNRHFWQFWERAEKTWAFQNPRKKVHCAQYPCTIVDPITYSLNYLLKVSHLPTDALFITLGKV
jgi:hypothetical protein